MPRLPLQSKQKKKTKTREILEQKLINAGKIVVVGIGNEFRGDDAAGLVVIERLDKILKKKPSILITTIIGGPAPENVTGEIIRQAPSHIILVDAATLNQQPGEVSVIDTNDIAGTSFSTHTLPIKILTDYLKSRHKCEIIVIGIEPACVDFGSKMSKEVRRSAVKLGEDIVEASQ
jgi:hydrogenase 3 maturation protease